MLKYLAYDKDLLIDFEIISLPLTLLTEPANGPLLKSIEEAIKHPKL